MWTGPDNYVVCPIGWYEFIMNVDKWRLWTIMIAHIIFVGVLFLTFYWFLNLLSSSLIKWSILKRLCKFPRKKALCSTANNCRQKSKYESFSIKKKGNFKENNQDQFKGVTLFLHKFHFGCLIKTRRLVPRHKNGYDTVKIFGYWTG